MTSLVKVSLATALQEFLPWKIYLPSADLTDQGHICVMGTRPPETLVPLGMDDFDDILKYNALFIDKSLFIREFIFDLTKVLTILRPRRFGKTMNLSMLESFLSLDADPTLFKRFAIAEDKEFVKTHCGKYPVVRISFKEFESPTWNDMKSTLWTLFSDFMKRKQRKYMDLMMEEYTDMNFKSLEPPARMFLFLRRLTDVIFLATGQPVIILIDEYDAPLNCAFKNGYYKEAAAFFGDFFSHAFKDNPSLVKACLMGILEVRGIGMLSGLNNFRTLSVSDSAYSQYFGFSKDEIAPYTKDESELEAVMEWYNGYSIGGRKLINPWSFSCWLIDRNLRGYWAGSSLIQSLSSVLAPHLRPVIEQVIELSCLSDFELDVPLLTTAIDYGVNQFSEASIWHFLTHLGYLTFRPNPEKSARGFVSVPNRELSLYWKNQMAEMMKAPKMDARVLSAFRNLQPAEFQRYLTKLILSVSNRDLIAENSYHVYILGLLQGRLEDVAQVFSNRESGHGYFDVAIVFEEIRKVIILELKVSESVEKLNQDAEKGFYQILEKDYLYNYREHDFLLIGISFFKRHVSDFIYMPITASEAKQWRDKKMNIQPKELKLVKKATKLSGTKAKVTKSAGASVPKVTKLALANTKAAKLTDPMAKVTKAISSSNGKAAKSGP